MVHPKKYPASPDEKTNRGLFNFSFFSPNYPAAKPHKPLQNICHGVQGPWPKKKLDTNADKAPTINPVRLPYTYPVIITIKVVGCTLITAAKGILDIPARVDIVPIRAISLESDFFLSNFMKKISNIIKTIIKEFKSQFPLTIISIIF